MANAAGDSISLWLKETWRVQYLATAVMLSARLPAAPSSRGCSVMLFWHSSCTSHSPFLSTVFFFSTWSYVSSLLVTGPNQGWVLCVHVERPQKVVTYDCPAIGCQCQLHFAIIPTWKRRAGVVWICEKRSVKPCHNAAIPSWLAYAFSPLFPSYACLGWKCSSHSSPLDLTCCTAVTDMSACLPGGLEKGIWGENEFKIHF